MRCFLIMCGLLCLLGCAQQDLLEMDVKTMDEIQRAKHLTALWKRCKEGVLKNQNIPPEEIKGLSPEEVCVKRIGILEAVYPYGKKAVEMARYKAHFPIYWFTRNCTWLAFYSDVYGQLIKETDPETSEKYRTRAKDAAAIAIQLFRDYQKYHNAHYPDPQLLPLLECNYELVGDNRSAYIVTSEYLNKLKEDRKRGNSAVELLREIERWEKIQKKLRDKLINNLESVPKV